MTSNKKKIRNLLNEIMYGFEGREMINNGRIEQSGLYSIWYPLGEEKGEKKYEIEMYTTYNDGSYAHIYKGKIIVNAEGAEGYVTLNERTTKTTSTMIENSLIKYYNGPQPKGSHDESGNISNLFVLRDKKNKLPKKIIVKFTDHIKEVGKIDIRNLDEDQIFDKLEDWIDNNVYGGGDEDE